MKNYFPGLLTFTIAHIVLICLIPDLNSQHPVCPDLVSTTNSKVQLGKKINVLS